MQPLSLQKAAPEESHYISHKMFLRMHPRLASCLFCQAALTHTHSVRYPLASQRCRADRWAALRGN